MKLTAPRLLFVRRIAAWALTAPMLLLLMSMVAQATSLSTATLRDLQVAMDYTSGELRATTEARAYAVGAFARYLVTGAWQTADEIVAPLAHGYALDAATREHCAVIVASALASMRAGVVPPFEVCGVVLAILRQHHPDAIVPNAFKVRT